MVAIHWKSLCLHLQSSTSLNVYRLGEPRDWWGDSRRNFQNSNSKPRILGSIGPRPCVAAELQCITWNSLRLITVFVRLIRTSAIPACAVCVRKVEQELQLHLFVLSNYSLQRHLRSFRQRNDTWDDCKHWVIEVSQEAILFARALSIQVSSGHFSWLLVLLLLLLPNTAWVGYENF